MDELEKIKWEIKNKKKKSKIVDKKNYGYILLSKTLITIILTLITLIMLKSNSSLKTSFYREVFEKNFSFAKINNLYTKYFGSSIPFGDFFAKQESVFDEKLVYTSKEQYLDGVKLTVANKYLVPNQLSGLVVFIGEKEGYGNTVIIQQVDGVDLWYGNIETVDVKLYDYIEKGKLIGTTKDDCLYLVYQKGGQMLSYEEFI